MLQHWPDLLKLMRHEGPLPEVTAERLGIPDGGGLAASVVKTYHAAHTGKLSVARLWRGTLSDGATVAEAMAGGAAATGVALGWSARWWAERLAGAGMVAAVAA